MPPGPGKEFQQGPSITTLPTQLTMNSSVQQQQHHHQPHQHQMHQQQQQQQQMANGMPLGGLEGVPKSGTAAHQGINCPSLGLDLPPIGLDLPPLLAPNIGLPFNQRGMPPYQGMAAPQPMP